MQGKRELKKSGFIKVDSTLCSGCKMCMYVCSLTHEKKSDPKLSRIQIFRDVQDGYYNEPQPCLQCDGPECLIACKVDAIEIDKNTGARIIDQEKCIGCKACIKACLVTPKRISFNHEIKKAFKCNLCGGDPQCVKYCPMGALTYKEAKWL